MLATCFVLCALAVRAGDVVVLPPAATPVAPGVLNWALRDATIAVGPRTRAIVLRLAPAGLAGVAEVRLFDGTDRLAWLAAGDLDPIRPATPAPAGPVLARSASSSTRAVAAAYPSAPRRRKRRPDFRRVDAAIAALMREALTGAWTGPSGMAILHVPVAPVGGLMPILQAPVVPVGALMPVLGMGVF